MLRRLRKKLELIEIWGWCPRPAKENLKGAGVRFSEDSWTKVDTILLQTSIPSFSAPSWSIWMIFGAFWSPTFKFLHCCNFGYKSYVDFDEILCGFSFNPILSPISVWCFSTMLFSEWICVVFDAFWNSSFAFSLIYSFGYKSYVDVDEIWCWSLMKSIF